jgi:hypothetical protein
MTTMWHVTSTRNEDAILAQGLRIDVGGWNTKYVWFFDDLEIALESARTGSWGGSRGDNIVLEVDVGELDVIPDPHPGWGSLHPGWDDHAFAVAGNVDPERIASTIWRCRAS